MGLRRWVSSWPVYRQLTGPDTLGRGRAAESPRSASLAPRLRRWSEVLTLGGAVLAVTAARRQPADGAGQE